MAQRNYADLDSRSGYAGSYSRSSLGRSRSFLYGEVKQVGTLTVGGTATDGDYLTTLTDPRDSSITYPVTVARATTPATNADLAAAIAAALNADPKVRGFADFSAAAAVVTYTAKRGGEVLSFATSAPAPGTLVAAITTPATVADLPVGIAVGRLATGNLRLLTSGDAARNVIGLVRKTTKIKPYDGTNPSAAWEAGYDVDVCWETDGIRVPAEGTVAIGDPVYARIVATGSEQLGALRASADGIAGVVTATPTAANDTYYQLTIHDPDTKQDFVFEVLGDASATATEICDALRVKMAADSAWIAAGYAATGTATLIITGPLGTAFTVDDSGAAGAWASITQTTTAVADTILLPGWTWESAASDGQIAELSIH